LLQPLEKVVSKPDNSLTGAFHVRSEWDLQDSNAGVDLHSVPYIDTQISMAVPSTTRLQAGMP
jgi:hypothetical protein